MLGGASAAGFAVNALLQLAAIGICGWYALRAAGGFGLPKNAERSARVIFLICAAATALLLIELVPLPPVLWRALPGREPLVAAMKFAGVAPGWAPITQAPDATLAALLSLLPPAAVLVLVLSASPSIRRIAVLTMIAVALVALALGAAQRLDGLESPLYLYEISSRGSPVGFFANRNHFATLLLCVLPFVIVPGWAPRDARPQIALATGIASGLVAVVLVVGVVAIGSRAGYLILPAVLIASLAARGPSSSMVPGFAVRGAWIVIAVIVLAIGVTLFANRSTILNFDNDAQHRPVLTRTTIAAASDYFPIGSGGGSFLRIYPQYEPVEHASLEYVNHAHNDYAEVLLEHGALGAVLVFAFVLWWASRVRATWAAPGEAGRVGRAAVISLGAVIAHSAVDYPLRTAAIGAVAALCVGLALMPDSTPARAGRALAR